MTKIKGNKQLSKEDDCGCGKPVKITERKKIIYKKTIRKK